MSKALTVAQAASEAASLKDAGQETNLTTKCEHVGGFRMITVTTGENAGELVKCDNGDCPNHKTAGGECPMLES